MLRDGSRAVGHEEQASALSSGAVEVNWCEVHGGLQRNARQRAALDANEAFLLREAERLQIWKPLGMVSTDRHRAIPKVGRSFRLP